MRSNIFALLAFAALASASAIPHSHEDQDISPRPRSPLEELDSYDCKGSGLCRSLSLHACDDAVNHKIIRNNDVNYGAPG